jgi:hypothetical protein
MLGLKRSPPALIEDGGFIKGDVDMTWVLKFVPMHDSVGLEKL